MLEAFLDTWLPQSCLLCGAGSRQALCAGCQADLPRLAAPLCPRCAQPLAQAAVACGQCLRAPVTFDATHAALRYAFPVDALVQGLKFAHRLPHARALANEMLPVAPRHGDLLLPVPLSAARLRERGFNQALEIARWLARACGWPLDTNALLRLRDTLPQSRLPWRTRARNVRHAFACQRDLTGLTVIVVDDVMTTGATLAAVATALKAQGAARVINWVAARAVKTLP